jgi:hypothetical protein
MRPKRSLEAVKEDKQRRVGLSGEVMKLEKITVRRIETLESKLQG